MTLLRTLIWFAIAAVAMLGRVWLAARPGNVIVEWRGWRLDTKCRCAAGRDRLLILLASRSGCSTAGSWARPGAFLEGWGESRRRRGYRELTQGLAAVAAGRRGRGAAPRAQGRAAAGRAAAHLLLSAQAAQLNGDRDGANRAFKAMLEDEQMAFLGLRGLIAQSLRDGNQAQALDYAERAFALRRRRRGSCIRCSTCRRSCIMEGGAGHARQPACASKVVSADRGRTLRALLLVERSRAAEHDGQERGAGLARDAFGLAPSASPSRAGWPSCRSRPATAASAMKTLERRLVAGAASRSRRALLKASGEKRSAEAGRRHAQARGHKPDDMESHLALAQDSARCRPVGGEARRHLESAGGSNPSVAGLPPDGRASRSAPSPTRPRCTTGWRAAPRPADKAWRCSACGAHH
jgi:HemY protein